MNDQTVSGLAGGPIGSGPHITPAIKDYFLDRLIDHLNALMRLDPTAMNLMLRHQVSSNEALKNSDRIFCRGGLPSVQGLVSGIANSLFGCPVATQYSGESGSFDVLVGFQRYTGPGVAKTAGAPNIEDRVTRLASLVAAEMAKQQIAIAELQAEYKQAEYKALGSCTQRVEEALSRIEGKILETKMATPLTHGESHAVPLPFPPMRNSDPLKALKARAQEDRAIAQAGRAENYGVAAMQRMDLAEAGKLRAMFGTPFPPTDIGARTVEEFCQIAHETAEVVSKLRELKARVHPYIVGEGDQASLEKSGLKKYLGDLEVTLEHAAFSANVAHKEAQRFVAIEPGDNTGAPDAGGPANPKLI